MSRRLALTLLTLGLLLLAGGLALWRIGDLLAWAAARQGVTLTVAEASPRHLLATGISAEGLSIERAELGWSWPAILSGRLDRLVLYRPRLAQAEAPTDAPARPLPALPGLPNTLAVHDLELAAPWGRLSGSIVLHEHEQAAALLLERPEGRHGLRLQDGRLHLESNGLELPGLRARRLTLDGPGELRLERGGLALVLAESGLLTAEGLDLAAGLHLPRLDLPVAAGDLLRLQDGALSSALVLEDARAEGRLGQNPARLTWPRSALWWRWSPAEGFQPDLRLSGGALAAPGWRMALEGVDAAWTGDGRMALSGRLQPLGPEAPVLPLRFDAQVTPQPDGALALAGQMSDPQNLLRLPLAGRQEADGRGEADLRLRPLRFQPEGLQPAELLPALASLRGVTGTVAAGGHLAWDPAGGLRPRLDLLLQNLSGTAGPVAFQGLNGVARLTRLSPLSTPPGQEVSVALLSAGLPMTDGLVRFQLDQGRLRLEEGALSLAGGRVRLEPTVLDLSAPRLTLGLQVQEVDLAQIVALTGLEGLSATGRLSGRLPLALHDGTASIVVGRLAAQEPGLLRYRPAEPPAALAGGGQPVQMLLQALDDFRYGRLELVLNGTAGGETTAALHLAGANPAFHDGYPLELNLNLAGKLDTILDQALTGYQIPDRIRQRMTEFGSPQGGKE